MKELAVTEANYLAGLIRRVQQNDSDAFAELYTLTYQRQYAYACRILRDERLAQDAIQEMYIVIFQSLGELREPKFFTTWMTSITQRICFDMRRKQQREPGGAEDELIDNMPDEAASPERTNEKRDLRDLVRQLPFKEREAITLKYFAEMELKDIARSMDCSVSSVTRYLQRGYDKIRQFYKEGGG